jgi:PST family polysaccharide transporter
VVPPPTASALGLLATAAAGWTFASAAGNRLLGFATTVLLARALGPAELGGIAILAVALGLGTLVQEFGTGAGLIYRRDDEPAVAGFVLVFQAAAGVVVIGATLAVAGVVAGWFENPLLAPALHALAPAFLVTPVISVATARLEKALDYRAKTVVETAGAVTQALVSVTVAFLGGSVWSFVAGVLAGRGVAAAVAWLGWWRPVSFAFGLRVAGETLAYSRYVVGEALLWFASANVDYLVVGRVLGLEALGVYRVGFSTAVTPASSLGPLTRVAFPAFVHARDDPALLRTGFVRATQYGALLGVPVPALLAVLAEPVVLVLYGERWLPAVPVLRVLAPYAVLWVAALVVGDVLKAVGLVRALFWLNAARVGLLVAALLVAAPRGLVAVAVAVLAVAVLTRALQLGWASRELGLGARDHVTMFVPAAAALAAMLAVVVPVRAALSPLPPPIDLVLHGTVGLGVYAAVALRALGGTRLRALGALARAAVGRRATP